MPNTTVAIQHYLDEWNGTADDAAPEPLLRDVLAGAINRLQWLCELMLQHQYARLTRGPLNLTPDELLSGVVERLIKAMRVVHPQTVRQFFALANRHMRWELNDFARRLDAQVQATELRDSQHLSPQATVALTINAGARRILEAIETLPEEEREVFTLMRIQGLTRADTAQVIGVAEKTVQRRLKRALIFLTQALHDISPSNIAH